MRAGRRPSADAATTRWVRALVPDDARAQVIDLAGATSLDTLAACCAGARLRVERLGRDAPGGRSRRPLAALFGPTRERETAPLPAWVAAPTC